MGWAVDKSREEILAVLAYRFLCFGMSDVASPCRILKALQSPLVTHTKHKPHLDIGIEMSQHGTYVKPGVPWDAWDASRDDDIGHDVLDLAVLFFLKKKISGVDVSWLKIQS